MARAWTRHRREVKRLVKRCVRALLNVLEVRLDRRYRVATAESLGLETLDLDHPERTEYTPSRWFSLPLALSRREVSEDDVFADLGSGKGRVVFQAARRYPFKRVIGVELSEDLTAIARSNIERHRERLTCADVELVCADVLEWDIPEDLTMVYLFNPFVGELFAEVVERLIAWVDRTGRRLQVVYASPTEHDLLLATGRVREHSPKGLLARIRDQGSIRRYEIAAQA